LEGQAQTPKARWQALEVFEHVLLRDPERHPVRRKAAALAVRAGLVDRAQVHLEVLLRAFPKDAEVKTLAGQCDEAPNDYKKAEHRFRAAIALAPTSVESYVRLAWLLRRHLDRPAEADQVMAQMVAANKDTLQAYLERAVYLKKFHGSLAGAAADLHKAL